MLILYYNTVALLRLLKMTIFEWLFGLKPVVIVEKETNFSNLPIGQQFQKAVCMDGTIYVKTDAAEYETTKNGWHCTKWYCVHEDFIVRV